VKIVSSWVLFVSLFAACGTAGSGTLATEVREVGAFDRIDVSSALTVHVTVDPTADRSVTVEYDDNLLDRIITEVRDSTLFLEITGAVNLVGDDQSIEIVMPALQTVTASGASSVTATGSVDSYVVAASGASSLDLSGLEAAWVDVDVSGASTVVVSAGEQVTGAVSGASSLRVLGSPRAVSVDSSGVSSVDVED
jgi:hypothetical protein